MNDRLILVSVKLVKEKELPMNITSIRSPNDAYHTLKDFIEDSDRELFVAMGLDIKNKPTYIEIVSKGNLNSAIVSPREVFKSALLSNSASIILAHNHPSGDIHPSEADINLTNTIANVGKILDIMVLDHIIIGDENYMSLKEENLFNIGACSSIRTTNVESIFEIEL